MTTYRDGQLILAWRKRYTYAAAVRFHSFFEGGVKCYVTDDRFNLITNKGHYLWYSFHCPFDIDRAEMPIAEWFKLENESIKEES